MRKLKLFTHCTILATTPTLLAYPQTNPPHITFQVVNDGYQQNTKEWVRPNTYDEIIQMLEDLESGKFERKYSPIQLERVNAYLATLAKEGILPNEFEEEIALEEDIYDLMYGEDSAFQLTCYLQNSSEYMIIPAVLNGYSRYNIVQCGKISHAWKKTKKFVKDHKKAIIIGAVVVVAIAAVTVAVVVASSAGVASAASTAAGAAGAAASGSGSSELSKSESSGSSSSPSESQTSPNETPIFKSALEEQISSFKENLAHENFFQSSAPGQGLSLEEIGRAVGPLFAHDSFNDHLANYPQFSQEFQSITSHPNFSLPPGASDNPVGFGHHEIDRRFSSNCGPMFSNRAQEINFNALSYQIRGEAARSYGYYDQAVKDFSKAIEMNPADPMPYLQRSASYFDMRQYDRAFEDFHHFAAQAEKSPEKISFSTPEFTIGFAKGLPKGVYESGKGMMLFLGDLVTHPIHTATQMYDALSTLARLTRDDQWGMIGEALAPEIHQLVTEWDTMPSDRRGELAGYALGKHGADILTPGAIAKIANKSAKAVQELTAICKNLKIAQETLVLETAAGVGNTAKVGEIVSAGRQTVFLGEELGFTAQEMGQLKQAGKLEMTVTGTYEHLSLPMQESIKLFDKAEEFLKPYREFMSETQCKELIHKAGVQTFPRPSGIPENFRVKVSDRGAGMIYFHPEHNHTSIRVMPGKPHSPWPYQQKPYVVQTKNGRILDKSCHIVSRDSPEAHIPLEEFVFIGD